MELAGIRPAQDQPHHNTMGDCQHPQPLVRVRSCLLNTACFNSVGLSPSLLLESKCQFLNLERDVTCPKTTLLLSAAC